MRFNLLMITKDSVSILILLNVENPERPLSSVVHLQFSLRSPLFGHVLGSCRLNDKVFFENDCSYIILSKLNI